MLKQGSDSQRINGAIEGVFGLPHEEFSGTNPSTKKPNGGYPSTWGIDYASGTGTPSADFTDNTGVDDGTIHASSFFVYSTTQTFYCMELTPPLGAPGSSLYVVPGKYQDSTLDQSLWFTPTLSGFQSNVAASATVPHSITMDFGATIRSYPGHVPY